MLLNHACFFIPLRRGAQQAVLRQQICASGALLNNNPIRTTRQRRAHGVRRSSLLSRFEDALLIHTNAFRRGATKLCSNPVRRAQRAGISASIRHQRAGGMPLPRKTTLYSAKCVFFLIDLADYTAVLLADIATFPSPRSAVSRFVSADLRQRRITQ